MKPNSGPSRSVWLHRLPLGTQEPMWCVTSMESPTEASHWSTCCLYHTEDWWVSLSWSSNCLCVTTSCREWKCLMLPFFLLSVELLGLILPFYTHTLTHLSRPSFLFGCFLFFLFLYVWISPSFNDVTKTWKTRRCEEEAGEETCIFWWLFFYIDLNVYLFFEGVFVTSMTNKDSFLYSLW